MAARGENLLLMSRDTQAERRGGVIALDDGAAGFSTFSAATTRVGG